MTEKFELIEVNCAECDEVVECFDDNDEFDCPYCGTKNVFVDSEDEELIEEDDEWEVVYDGDTVLKPGISILWTNCRKHGGSTDHLWTGQRLRCLVCWPSWKPKGYTLRNSKYD